MVLRNIHQRVEASGHKKWQVYLLLISLLISTGLYFDVGSIISALQTIEQRTSHWYWIVILGFQGVLLGLVAESVYEQGDRYAKAASHQFGSKDRTLLFRIGVMTFISGIVTKIVPDIIRSSTEYLMVQSMGAILVLGILLVHKGTSNWNLETEWPAILAGILLTITPSAF